MKFETKEDVALPQQVLFDLMADFQMFERVAIRRGAEVTRSGSMALHGTAHLNFAGVNAKLVFIWPNSVPPKKWCF